MKIIFFQIVSSSFLTYPFFSVYISNFSDSTRIKQKKSSLNFDITMHSAKTVLNYRNKDEDISL